MTAQTTPAPNGQAPNGAVATAPITTADPVQATLVQLIQMSSQTNSHLQKLTSELSTMNRQLFNGGETTRAYQPPAAPADTPAPAAIGQAQASGPVATIAPDRLPQPWQKDILISRCVEIGITKVTTMTGKWKIIFYLDGEGWSPMALGWRKGEFKSLIRLVRHVVPEISEDHFSEANFSQRNTEHQEAGRDGNYEETIIAPEPFTVEWFKKPGSNGRTYAYIERVYPTPGGATTPTTPEAAA